MQLSNMKGKLFLLTRSGSLYILFHFYIISVFSTSLSNIFRSYFPLSDRFLDDSFSSRSHSRWLSAVPTWGHCPYICPMHAPSLPPAGTRAVTGAVLQDVLLAASRKKPGLCHCHLINGKVLGLLKKKWTFVFSLIIGFRLLLPLTSKPAR